MLVIVGLGNPGIEYNNTYHNMGFKVVESVAKNFGEKFSKTICNSETCSFFVNEERILLVKPQTFMNNSGSSVKEIVKKFKIDTAKNLIVISDDVDLNAGTIRIRELSHNSSHNGIRDIVEKLGTNEFIRVKVSICPRPENLTLSNFVLSKIKSPEAIEAMEKAVSAITDYINDREISAIMQKYSN